MFNRKNLKELLSEYDKDRVEIYIDYCNKVATETKSNGVIANPWFSYKTDNELANNFKAVRKDNLEFDGKHITILKTGVTYDYIAYKNKMFLAYPESIIDVQIVRESDMFSFEKKSGKVIYSHEIGDPFGNPNIVGCYCIIKNKRGDFLTTLSKKDIEKHRKVAKTDYIWQKWFDEMTLKTVIKKACKLHFADLYQNIETIDNENYDLENSLELPIEAKQAIEEISTIEQLEQYYRDHKGKYSGIKKCLIKELGKRKEQIEGGF